MKIEIGEKSKEKSFSIFKKKISFFFRYIKNGCNILSKKKKKKKVRTEKYAKTSICSRTIHNVFYKKWT